MPKLIITSPSLAKRLAEAADGYRDGRFHYFLSKLQYDFRLVEVSGNTNKQASDAADKKLAELNDGNPKNRYEKFGPYRSKKVFKKPIEYDAIRVSFLLNKELVYSEILSGDTDSIIMTVAAYDKFFLPYFTRLYGPDVASKLRKNAIKRLQTKPVISRKEKYPPPITPESYSLSTSSGGSVIHSERTYSS